MNVRGQRTQAERIAAGYLITVTQAASEVGISVQQMGNWCREGKVTAERHEGNHTWLIDRAHFNIVRDAHLPRTDRAAEVAAARRAELYAAQDAADQAKAEAWVEAQRNRALDAMVAPPAGSEIWGDQDDDAPAGDVDPVAHALDAIADGVRFLVERSRAQVVAPAARVWEIETYGAQGKGHESEGVVTLRLEDDGVRALLAIFDAYGLAEKNPKNAGYDIRLETGFCVSTENLDTADRWSAFRPVR